MAKRQGRLHRNFQSYSTQPDLRPDRGLGRLHDREGWRPTYSQNAKTLEEYCDHLDQSRLPVVRGLALARDDLARRAVIMALMYQGQVDRAGMAAGLPSSPRGRSIQAGWRSAAPTAGCRWRA